MRAHDGNPRFLVSRVHEPGTVLGSYVLESLLGEGAIGRVYRAEHRTLGRHVALKVLRSEFAEKPVVVRRFFGEARAVNQIAHENIVEITDFVQHEDGTCYYIMELLEGETLQDRFEKRGPIGQTELIRIAVQITSALQAVHDQSIVHRDLKPENVFLTSRGDRTDFVKVLDFGVAKLARSETTQTTVAGMLVGTPDYMSPEQARGCFLDHRSDVYSTGVVLYELFTGSLPFEGDSPVDVMLKHVNDAAPLPQSRNPWIEPEIAAILMKCLEKDPGARFQNMGALSNALTRVTPRPATWAAHRETEEENRNRVDRAFFAH